MEKSKFQFTNPVLTHMFFEMNSDFESNSNKEVQIKQQISVEIMPYDGKKETTVAIRFELGEQNDDCPFYMTVVEQASFKWGDELGEKQVENLLNQNAPTLLLSYLRPIVSQVTAASPVGPFNIPFMNFTKNAK